MSATMRFAPGVMLHPELADGSAERVVELPEGRLVRVSADMARLLDAVAASDAPATAEALAERLGAPWTPELVRVARARLDELGVTGDGRPPSGLRFGRFEYRAPMSLQVTLTRRPVWGPRVLTRPGPAVVALALTLAGVVVLAGELLTGTGPLHRPAALGTYLLVLAGQLTTVGLHELAHGAVLSAHGGRPRRFGAMLFYLTPAFFCDVTDAWRLAPSARVKVAFAGIATQAALGGAAAVASQTTDGDLQQGLLYYALLCYLLGAVNFLPFVKLDGYIALAGGLNVSHLRARSIRDFQSRLARLLFGVRAGRELPELDWAPWFGAACALAPVVLLTLALKTLGTALAPLGVPAAILLVALAGIVVSVFVSAVARFVHAALQSGAGRARTFGVLAAAAAALGFALAAIEVPRTYTGGYATVDGTPTLAVPIGTPPDALRRGTAVRLRRAGLLPGATVARATIAGAPRECEVPFEALLPVRGDRYRLRATCAALSSPGGVPATGRASVRRAEQSAAAWLVELAVGPALRTLGITQ
jgi:putative peptide zinc metalloprotease protein